MTLSSVNDVDWKCSVQLTRKQVMSLGKLAEFVGNIEKDISANFSDAKSIDWTEVRFAFMAFSQALKADAEFQQQVSEALRIR